MIPVGQFVVVHARKGNLVTFPSPRAYPPSFYVHLITKMQATMMETLHSLGPLIQGSTSSSVLLLRLHSLFSTPLTALTHSFIHAHLTICSRTPPLSLIARSYTLSTQQDRPSITEPTHTLHGMGATCDHSGKGRKLYQPKTMLKYFVYDRHWHAKAEEIQRLL